MLNDSEERKQATDPSGSFIVQAPAGSGKTELLTQRYLRLLSTVDSPEQIIALTFTKKAASEMQERILLALERAAEDHFPASAHQQATANFAKAALQRSDILNWQLLENSSRLKIMTIDALCHYLTRSIPLYEQQTPFSNICEYPEYLYRRAARSCLRYAIQTKELHSTISVILEHLDNRQDRLENLFCDFLKQRQLWLEPVLGAREQQREHYEDALKNIEQHHLKRLFEEIPREYREELQWLCSTLAGLDLTKDSPLKNWFNYYDNNRAIAAALCGLVLTSTGEFRKSFDHHVGLSRKNCENSLYDELKSRSKAMLEEFATQEGLILLFNLVKNLPQPFYSEEQWQVLQALLTLLPFLVAHLQLEFSEKNEIDFTSISEQALQALGDEELPTDLALYLDTSIRHLLVDEFQDTSIQQFQILTKLTATWLPDEGKTLFLVGDPMQSIYRFRQAEVGLFLKVQKQGWGSLQLKPLQLTANFRSKPEIITWINRHFVNIFPISNDIEAGAVSFHPSIATKGEDNNSLIYACFYTSKQHEAIELIKQVKKELEIPEKTIAILVRSRNLLSEIIPQLRKADIAFQGTELENLSELQHVTDVWSLTKSLLLPADRLCWLAFLRSPFCGLNLSDLHSIANFSRKKSIRYALAHAAEIQDLSKEGLERCKFIFTIMNQALENRQQKSLTAEVIDILMLLNFKKILSRNEEADVNQLLNLLSSLSEKGETLNIDQIEEKLTKSYTNHATPARLHIMTIHKSKGLEFDCVFLPGLGSKTAKQDKLLLRWLKLATETKETLLLSPIAAADNPPCSLYNYLGDIDKEKEHYEQQRLFYVAVTRAKEKLFLSDYREKPGAKSFRDLLRGYEFLDLSQAEDQEKSIRISSQFSRLPIEFYRHQPKLEKNSFSNAKNLLTSSNFARIIGVVTHELLQWICNNHPEHNAKLPWNLCFTRFLELGFSNTSASKAIEKIKVQIDRLFSSSLGQWICQAHNDEKNEYALLINESQKLSTKIIDRTFKDAGYRWIIDFKTGIENEESQDSHREQLNEYARLWTKFQNEPIKCGIYYLNSGHWLSWLPSSECSLLSSRA